MKKQILSVVLALSSACLAVGATDPVIMKIDGKAIPKSEFEYIYRKNNNETIDKKNLDEYITLFKNFKLKVIEAEEQGLDTTAAFREELEGYRNQLSKPYLANLPVNEELIKREYDRSKEDVEISHILVTYSGVDLTQSGAAKHVFQADTLAAYKKILQIQKRLAKGESFEKVAKEVSNDLRSLQGDKPGYLGWFTAMRLIPAMEDAAYNTPVGQVSAPVRTSFGYHLIKVNSRQPDPGQIKAAHILILCPANADTVQVSDAENKINAIYEQVIGGEDFGELAKKMSDDKASAVNGGDLSWFGFGAMVPEFQAAAFSLKDTGEVTKPVRTQFGFHLIKLLDRKPFPPYEARQMDIRNVLKQNPGTEMILNLPGINKLKEENGFSKNEKSYTELYKLANTVYPTDSVFLAQFGTNEDVLFIANDHPYTVTQFIAFLENNSASNQLVVSTDFLTERLNAFESDCLLKEEDRMLEKKYPEFRNLIHEYRDGILLFDISNREVWDKAAKDTLGLKSFFDQHKTKYAWDEPRYKGYVVLCKDTKTKKKMLKEVQKMEPDSAVNFLLKNYRVGDVSYVKVEKGLFTKGDNIYVDEAVFKSGKVQCPEEFADYFVLGKLLTDIPDDYTDVKGLVITDYQQYLEDKWVEMLNKKHKVEIFTDVINTIK